ncbi:MAG: NAD-dependent epimerase/dehydratase family protein, partial [Planctomycetales bacterium]
ASHYGALIGAIDQFVHSFALGHGYHICALRPTGIYGVARPIQRSKWFQLIRDVVDGKQVTCCRGGKEVHAADVAKAVELLLGAEQVAGEVFNCYDRYVSEYEVARIANEISGKECQIEGERKQPKHQIETGKLRSIGMQFGGEPLLRKTIGELIGNP